MKKNFYVDIDSVLDTRAGTIARMNPEIHAQLAKGNYHKRKGDFFPGIDPVEWRKLYEAREVETLMESMLTNVFQFLGPQIADVMKDFMTREMPEHMRPSLEVNIHPYALTDDEKAGIRTAVYAHMQGMIGVEVVDIPLDKLTPDRCSDRYCMMVMYDYHHYLNAHSHALIKSPKPFLAVIAPMVYFNTDPETNEEAIDQLKNGINALTILEASVAPRIGLRFVNADIFSIVYPDDRVSEQFAPDTSNERTIEELDKILVKQKEAQAKA